MLTQENITDIITVKMTGIPDVRCREKAKKLLKEALIVLRNDLHAENLSWKGRGTEISATLIEMELLKKITKAL